MATVDWLGAGMDVVDGVHAVGRTMRDTGALQECEVAHCRHPSHCLQVRSSVWGQAGSGWFSWEGLHTGRHEKRTMVHNICTDASVVVCGVRVKSLSLHP